MENKSPGSVHSNAFNFGEFVTGGVDPRTGLYTCSLSLGAVRSADLNGPSFGLALGFNPLDTRNTGFGLGWSLATTRYDTRSKMMTLFSGERYKAVETVAGLRFREMKLESVRVVKTGAGRFDVRYKDGHREELTVQGGSLVAVPTRIIAANGAGITLLYKVVNQYPELIEVRDDQRTLLKISRKGTLVTLSQNPDTASTADFTMKLDSNDRVVEIGLPEGRGWDLEYSLIDEVGYLKRVVTPLGAVEIIRYKEQGHLLPASDVGATATLPHVMAHDIYPGHGQPKTSRTFTFSDRNFLGHGLSVEPSDDGDPLYSAPWSYQYASEERLVVDGKVHSHIKRTYNKFHLLVAQVTTCGEAVTSQFTEYHLATGKSFNEQPAHFRLPRVQRLKFENRLGKKQREETTITEFDAVGNLLRHVGPDGVTTQSEFYPAVESPDCPVDPLGFVRFEKQRTVTAAPGGGASTCTRFRHALHPTLQGSTLASVVLIEEQFFEKVKDTEVLRSKVEHSYFDTPADRLRHGALQEQRSTRNGRTTRTAFSSRLEGARLHLTHTVHGFDGTSQSTTQVLSSYSGLTLSETDKDGGRIDYEYDAIGRCVRKTLSPGAAHAASTTWVYQEANSTSPATVTVTDPAGGVQTVTHDGLGRVIGIKELDCDNPDEGASQENLMRTVYSALHDKAGHLVEQTRTDWWDGIARPAITRLVYDSWGQVKQTRHADGRVEHREFDPVALRETLWQEGMGKTVSVFNAFGKPKSIEMLDRKGESLGKSVLEYDGYGRTRSQTDQEGNKTLYHYDVFDRLVRSELPDGHAVETEYADHSAEILPVRIKVDTLELGRQVFDGLNRLTESTVGGRTFTAGYVSGSSQAGWQMGADGKKIEFTWSQGVNRLAERKADGLLARFTYDALHGKPETCIEQGREHRFAYYPSGRLKSETTVYGEHRQTTSHTWSLGGRPLTFIDGLGNEHKSEYDSWGRKSAFTQGRLRFEYTYDTAGLLALIDARDTSTALRMKTHLSYDDIGRETTRRFEVEGQASQTLTSSYTPSGKLAQKVLKRGTKVLRDERFTYDVRGRLSHYTCEGTQRPRDPYGKEIVEQTFTFDALDNLLTLQTRFPQGVNLTTFSYSKIDFTQLTDISHSHADYPQPITLQYDANGRMIKDDQGRTLTYDTLGRLTGVSNAQGQSVRGYQYDGFDRLMALSQPGSADTQRYYRGGHVINDVRGGDSCSVVRHEGLLLGQHQVGVDAGVRMFGTDQQQSVLTQLQNGRLADIAYSPFGHREAEGGFFSLPGFNGEQFDPVTGLYLLGNGYRAYSPTLMRFMSPDSMSPFGAGGMNAYAYCLGDPVNRVDPTGHVSWESIAGIALAGLGIAISVLTLGAATPLGLLVAGLGVASGITAVASEVAHELAPDSVAGDILGYIGLGLGLASLGVGLAGAAVKGASKLAGAFKSGLSGDSREAAKAMARGMGGRNTPGTSAGPGTWTYKTRGFRGRVDGQKAGRGAIPGFEDLDDISRDKFFRFKDAIKDHGRSPSEAANALGGKTYYNEMVPFKSPNPRQIRDPGYFNDTGYTEIRLNQATRLFFFADHDTRTVTMHAFGHTVRGA
ncbi:MULTISPECIES: RHS repeat-associated core domain-containing protein [unclassified Pseudomonas]|uniref:RHS repeat-associated core domain-containing protein n=1 Tax=unclassified Pseudomonas TaxID=196821 RepID=UPI00200EFC76|nr:MULTISPECIES: RHS repeat-associated core domain-containing protein [unclassified Pseudomonas]